MSSLQTLEDTVSNLSQQVTDLLDTFILQRSTVETRIETAVAASENAAQVPLVNMATNLVLTQALLVTLITP